MYYNHESLFLTLGLMKERKKEGRRKEGGREEEKEENGKHCLKDTGQSIGLNKGYV